MKVYSLTVKEIYNINEVSCDGPGNFFLSYNLTFKRRLRDDGFVFIRSVGIEKHYLVDIDHHSKNNRYMELKDICIKHFRNIKITDILYV